MQNVKITLKEKLTDNITRLKLSAVDGTSLAPWEPGAHIELHLTNGLLRQYSLCGASNNSDYEIAILRESNSRGGSSFIHDELEAGHELQISEPKNHFPFTLPAKDSTVLFLAAGIGITPILPMAELCEEKGQPFEFSVCATNASAMPYGDRIRQLPNTKFNFSNDTQSSRLSVKDYLKSKSTHMPIYVCGPQRFIDDVIESALALGWNDTLINREYFSIDKSSLESDEDKAFDVEIKSTGQIIHVPADETILTTLEDSGIFLPVACEEGVCGTCVTKVLEGDVEHRDVFLNEEERADGALMTPCCSRAKGTKLVLDL